MPKEAVITVRVPIALRRKLESHARRERRSLSAQIASYLERGIERERAAAGAPGRLLGLYAGAPVPTDADFVRARRLLWGRLGRHRVRGA